MIESGFENVTMFNLLIKYFIIYYEYHHTLINWLILTLYVNDI